MLKNVLIQYLWHKEEDTSDSDIRKFDIGNVKFILKRMRGVT